MWAIVAEGTDMSNAQQTAVVVVILALAVLLPIAASVITIYQKLWPKPARGDEVVTAATLNAYKVEVNGKIDSVRRDMLERAIQSKEYHDENKARIEENKNRLDRCITREELLNLIKPMMDGLNHNNVKLEELDSYIHARDLQLQSQINQIGKDFEEGKSQILQSQAKQDVKLQFLLKRWRKPEKDETNGSDDDFGKA